MIQDIRPERDGSSLDAEETPQNLDAERNVLGSILLDPKTFDEVAFIVKPEHFFDEHCRVTYEHMHRLKQSGSPIDVILLREAMKNSRAFGSNAWDAGLMRDYLLSHRKTAGVACHARYYAQLVRDASARRDLQMLSLELAQAARNGIAPASALARFQEQAGELQRGLVDPQQELESITCSDLDTMDIRVDYLIPGVLVAGQPCLVSGPRKSLKTNVLVDLAISLAVCGNFLGYFEVRRQANVGMLSGESGLATLQETARRVARTTGSCLSSITQLIWSSKLPRFDEPRSLTAFDQWIQRNRIDVAIVDPAYLCMPSVGENSGNLFTMGSVLTDVNEVCQGNGCTLVIAHHVSKGRTHFDIPQLGDEAWSGWAEWARQWILLNRRRPYNPEQRGQHALWLATGGSAGHAGVWGVDIDEGERDAAEGREWDVEFTSVRSAKEDEQRQKLHQKAVDKEAQEANNCQKLQQGLRDFPEGETAHRLREVAGLNGSSFATAIRTLLGDGLARTCQVTKAGRTYDGYQPDVSETGTGD